MSRPMDALELTGDEPPTERRVARSTARAFAAAISALLVSTLVVTRSDAALESDGTAVGAVASSGLISLQDDDEGRSLFTLEDVGPGRPFERCVEILYDGTIVPVVLSLGADSQGDLSAYLHTTIESGSGGDFESCEGFEPGELVFEGTLADLVDGERTDVATLYNTDTRRTFRVRLELADTNEALGRSATTAFIWEVRPT